MDDKATQEVLDISQAYEERMRRAKVMSAPFGTKFAYSDRGSNKNWSVTTRPSFDWERYDYKVAENLSPVRLQLRPVLELLELGLKEQVITVHAPTSSRPGKIGIAAYDLFDLLAKEGCPPEDVSATPDQLPPWFFELVDPEEKTT